MSDGTTVRWWVSKQTLEVVSVAGDSGTPIDFFTIATTDIDSSTPPENLYVLRTDESDTIHAKPPQPDPNAVWDRQNHRWIEPTTERLPPGSITFDWGTLAHSLTNSPEWEKAYNAAKKYIPCTAAFTYLICIITVLHDTEKLNFAFNDFRAELLAALGSEFTSDEVESINSKLEATGFRLRFEYPLPDRYKAQK